MNEELLSLLTLNLTGFDTEQLFEEKLNELFLQHPENRDLLEMECMDFHEARIYFSKHFDFLHMNQVSLNQCIIKNLKYFYENMDFQEFAGKIAGLWDVLPFHTNQKENLFYMVYYFYDMFIAEEYVLLKEHIEQLLSYCDQ